MKITNLFNIYDLYNDEKKISLKEGDLIKGKILEIIEDLAIIDIKNFGVVKAYVEGNFTQYEDKLITFTVKSLLPNKIILTPVLEKNTNDSLKLTNLDLAIKKEEYLMNILAEYKLEQDEVAIEFLDSLVKYNVSINRENLEKGLWILDKLEQLIKMFDEDMVLLVNSYDELKFIGDEDIRNILIQPKDEHNGQFDISEYVKEKFCQLLERNTIDSNLIKTISIFIKYDIKPSMNNIEYFLELVENTYLFSENFMNLENIIEKKFTSNDKYNIIKNDNLNMLDQNIIRHKTNIQKIIQLFKDGNINFKDGKIDDNIFDSIEEIQNKFEFLQQLYEHLNIICFPFKISKFWDEGFITLVKNKKKKDNPKEAINVFIDLKTNNFGNINIYLRVIENKIDVLFKNINKDDIIFFKDKENLLNEMVNSTGYKINSIKYTEEKENNMLDYLIVNPNPIYFLDVQV
ncbi:hypothetical protein EDD65_105114 [Keratinibaculum paraultunense]|uniref:Flagellar hook-length control protein FliK n=1 Tax=Keratinibaculum paraultunense TaxID=1278232 RepID=A0A4R3KWC6_9FIRM|nr:hypothetical protein [Keratinibaculum paraultunense]QQY80750.1 hypothetical protein JL105_05505 [Keratinibaculum paraultunense]TCS89640.1 hypothetical protein EDD65_105114 [Keratinibaculum paraultunense]